MSASAELGPIRIDQIIQEVRERGATELLEVSHEGKGLVRDPRTVERLILDLVLGICSTSSAKRVAVSSRDLVRVDQHGTPGRWTEVVIHEPAAANDQLAARVHSTLLVARARIAATLLIAGDGRSPATEVSQTPTGTTVRLVLPCTDPEEAAQPVVLLVDDDEVIRLALTEALRSEGCRVIAASNGQAALERATGKISLLLSDLLMPGMNGLELARRLKEKQPGVKVVLMSGMPLSRGALIPGTFLFKPLDLNVLLAQIPAILGDLRTPPRSVAV